MKLQRRGFLVGSSALGLAASFPVRPGSSVLVVNMRDVMTPDPAQCFRHLKRGDVIDVLPTGLHPGTMTLRQPHWRVIEAVGMPDFEAFQYKIDEKPGDFGERDVKLRAIALDVDNPALPADLRSWLADWRRRQPVRAVDADLLRRITIRKGPGLQPVTFTGDWT